MKRTAIGYPPSDIFGRLPDQAPAPSRPKQVAPLRVFLVVIHRIDDTVGPETAEILAQLAPRRQQPNRLEIAHRNRPDGALAVAAMFVAVEQRDLLALVNLRARSHHVDAVGFPVPGASGAARGVEHERPQPLGDGGGG